MEELCSPDLQAAGADAGRALFDRLLSESTATDALGRLLELDTKTYLVDDIFTRSTSRRWRIRSRSAARWWITC